LSLAQKIDAENNAREDMEGPKVMLLGFQSPAEFTGGGIAVLRIEVPVKVSSELRCAMNSESRDKTFVGGSERWSFQLTSSWWLEKSNYHLGSGLITLTNYGGKRHHSFAIMNTTYHRRFKI